LDEIEAWRGAYRYLTGTVHAAAARISVSYSALCRRVPILGVCLGHQCIGEAFGATVDGAGEIVHGKVSNIYHDGAEIYRGLPNPLQATRYHSLSVRRDSIPASLEVSAWTDSGLVMGIRHRELPVEGVQFHPESIMTPAGKSLLHNFLEGPP
jgi:anthranilate synthase/aminodeoxychorismate synthase-like glutamine amidotransferase